MGALTTAFLYLFGRRDLRRFAILIVLMLVGSALEIASLGAVPLFVQLILNQDSSQAAEWLEKALLSLNVQTLPGQLPLWGGLLLGLLFLFRTFYLVANFWLQEHLLRNRQVALGSRIFRAYLQAPYRLLLCRNSGTVINYVSNETERLIEQFLAPALNFLRNSVIVLAVLLLLALYDPIVSLGAFCALAVAGGVFILSINHRLKLLGEEAHLSREKAVKAIVDGVGAFREAKLQSKAGFFLGRLHQSLERQARSLRFYHLLQRGMWPGMEFLTVAVLLLTMAIMLILGRDIEAIAPTLALIAVALARLKGCLTELMLYYSTIRYQSSLVLKITAELRELESNAEKTSDQIGARKPQSLEKGIVAREIDFQYDDDQPVLREISLEIAAGTSVALTGTTGSGKTTLANILLGLLEPDSGSVTIDGREMRACKHEWQLSIGYVPQDIYLLDDTVRANVALGIPDQEVDAAALRKALQAAQIYDFVCGLPDGEQTVLGERGTRLSGGQRQRIGIARALYHNPSVLILDEATSALDSSTESALADAIEQLRGTHTVITIAHRMSTVRRCDQIFFLENGRLAARGTYEQLLATSPSFRDMIETAAATP